MTFAEVVITYALVMQCTDAGRCPQSTSRVALAAQAIAEFPTMEACAQAARRDTERFINKQHVDGFEARPIIGNYRVYYQPTCYPVRTPKLQ